MESLCLHLCDEVGNGGSGDVGVGTVQLSLFWRHLPTIKNGHNYKHP